MKIYLFCPETGVYQGEDYADVSPAASREAELPAGATTIAPPAYGQGEVPVFLSDGEKWVVRHLVRLHDWRVSQDQQGCLEVVAQGSVGGDAPAEPAPVPAAGEEAGG